MFERVNSRIVGLTLLVALPMALAAYLLLQPAPAIAQMQMQPGDPHLSAMQDDHGFTDGWYEGTTVKFYYVHNFFCAQPPTSGAPSGCEVGADAITPPVGAKLPDLYVMTPLGFRPDASTLQCPIVGSCINHPSTIDLSRLFGAGAANVPLPAHSHIIDQVQGGWWDLKVVGVKDLATWNQVVAGKSIDTVRALQAADPTQTHITADIETNTFLFFNVQRPQ